MDYNTVLGFIKSRKCPNCRNFVSLTHTEAIETAFITDSLISNGIVKAITVQDFFCRNCSPSKHIYWFDKYD